jgi:hypothetical protein
VLLARRALRQRLADAERAAAELRRAEAEAAAAREEEQRAKDEAEDEARRVRCVSVTAGWGSGVVKEVSPSLCELCIFMSSICDSCYRHFANNV